MAKVKWAKGIDYVQGALAKPKKTANHKCGDYLIGTHRTAPTQSPDCTRLYLKKANAYDRATLPSNNELAARERFAAVRAMVYARKRDLEHISQDQLDFMAQKDTATGKKTMYAYLWKVCGDLYDAQHNG